MSESIKSSSLRSERIFYRVLEQIDNNDIDKLNYEAKEIINKCTRNFNLYDILTIILLRQNRIESEMCHNILSSTIKVIFSSSSMLFLNKCIKELKNNKLSFDELFDKIMSDLKNGKTDTSTIVLFDFFVFLDFRNKLRDNYKVISLLIEAYQLYDPDVVSSKLFKGSSIIAKLLQNNNEAIVYKDLTNLLGDRDINSNNVKMIGGGGSSIVLKVEDNPYDKVLKLGETRNKRKVYINYRILASLLRELVTNEIGEEQFYHEVQIVIKTGDVTVEELNELIKDMDRQGLIWEDPKLVNCGVLPDGYDNECSLPVDYVEIAGRITDPCGEAEFMTRKRRVVVLDNDDIKFNPLKRRI